MTVIRHPETYYVGQVCPTYDASALKTKDKVRLLQKFDESYNKAEQFYREYYPEWCDIQIVFLLTLGP